MKFRVLGWRWNTKKTLKFFASVWTRQWDRCELMVLLWAYHQQHTCPVKSCVQEDEWPRTAIGKFELYLIGNFNEWITFASMLSRVACIYLPLHDILEEQANTSRDPCYFAGPHLYLFPFVDWWTYVWTFFSVLSFCLVAIAIAIAIATLFRKYKNSPAQILMFTCLILHVLHTNSLLQTKKNEYVIWDGLHLFVSQQQAFSEHHHLMHSF
jgi:hypothetical protein